MLKTVSSVFAFAVAVVAATVVANDGSERSVKSPTAVTAMKPVAGDSKKQDVFDTVTNSGSFETLTKAINAAGLANGLKDKGPFTVFAPTDKAFAKLPQGTVESLLRPENKEKLKGILKYHIVPGHMLAADITKLKSAKTVNGESIAIKTVGENVSVNNAEITESDIVCTNGVIHVIDTVLMPTE